MRHKGIDKNVRGCTDLHMRAERRELRATKFAIEVLCESISIRLNTCLGTICKAADIWSLYLSLVTMYPI